MLKNPKVSVAICTYNGAKFIKSQLESVINQTYKNTEIIIIDDKSIDDTVEICRSYIDNRIFLSVNEQNLGYTKNFEKAIMQCSGKYICLCDQDDIWNLNKIEILVDEIGNNELIYHDSDFIDNDGAKITMPTMAERYHMYQGNNPLPFLLFNCISGHASMFKSDLIKYLLPFDKRFFHDWWLAYVAVNVGSIKFINKVLVNYRQHTDSITDNLSLKPTLKNKGKRVKIDLDWLEKIAKFDYNKQPMLISKAFSIFKTLLMGKGRWRAFIFIVSYYDELFYIANRKRKSLISKINFARKLSLSNKSLL
ncbi:glycosyltransferase [Pedobacter lithocola]|uniref:Glycosyltransferase n=1 Tax=Pedobacter lithocola TaxID=1908239 RepID=A0ABV8PDC9_9SPHI